MADIDGARSYGDQDSLRVPSRPIAFDRTDDEAVFHACRQAIQRSEALLLRTSDAATKPLITAGAVGGDILRLFYSSRITNPEDLRQRQADLDQIVRVSRKENPSLSITGVLIANKKMYSQIIEGPSGSIQNLIGRISCDARHQDIKIISRDISKTRLFPDWSMGFVLTDLELEVQKKGLSTEDDDQSSAVLSFCSSIGIRTI